MFKRPKMCRSNISNQFRHPPKSNRCQPRDPSCNAIMIKDALRVTVSILNSWYKVLRESSGSLVASFELFSFVLLRPRHSSALLTFPF